MTRLLPFALLAGLAFLAGCRSPRVGELAREMRGPAYARTLTTPHHVLEVRYLPRALRLAGEFGLSDSTRLTPALRDSLAELSGAAELVFVMRLAPKDEEADPTFANDVVYGRLSGYASYAEAQQAYASGLQERIWLEADGRKIPLAGYQMENSYGMSPARTFLLSFPEFGALRKARTVQLVLDDIVPGMARQKITWKLPVGKYDDAI
jgi:hypothetical protein